MAGSRSRTIFIVSDGRGETCAQLVRAALVQFEDQRYRFERESNVLTADQVREIVKRAGEAQALVFYTLVGEETRKAMLEASALHLVPIVDLLGPAFSALHDFFKRARKATPGLLYESERERFDRYEAIDYTLRHDDGRRLDDMNQADVVLVGVSRTSKSSTSFFLAYEGIKAANVPLVHDHPPPPQLLAIDPAKVVGLRANVMRLMTVRQVRAPHIGLTEAHPYLRKEAITREVLEANQQMRQYGWESFDVSYMAIEEIARRVMSLIGLKGPRSY